MRALSIFTCLSLLAAIGCGDDASNDGNTAGANAGTTAGTAGTAAGDGTSGAGAGAGSTAGTGAGTNAGTSGGAGAGAGTNAGQGGAGGEGGAGASGSRGGVKPQPIDCTSAEINARTCKACAVDTSCDDPVYTDNGDGTVSSTCCDLEWRKAFDAGTKSWADAAEYCAELELAGTGYRLPTIAEVQTLLISDTQPTIDAAFFPGVTDEIFWSSSAGDFSTVAWELTFFNGSAMGGQLTKLNHVRCVR